MRAAVIALLLLILLPGCMGGPSPADVEADRARWTAVRDVTADGVVDEGERPALAAFLIAWDDKITADEKAAGAQRDPQQILAGLLRAYGVAAVQVFLGPELQRRAPALFAAVDGDGDGLLSEAELLSIRPDDPAFAAVVIVTVHALLRDR